MGTPIETHCARCLRPAPAADSTAFLEWEVVDDDDVVICPECITPEEQQAMDQELMALADKADPDDSTAS